MDTTVTLNRGRIRMMSRGTVSSLYAYNRCNHSCLWPKPKRIETFYSFARVRGSADFPRKTYVRCRPDGGTRIQVTPALDYLDDYAFLLCVRVKPSGSVHVQLAYVIYSNCAKMDRIPCKKYICRLNNNSKKDTPRGITDRMLNVERFNKNDSEHNFNLIVH